MFQASLKRIHRSGYKLFSNIKNKKSQQFRRKLYELKNKSFKINSHNSIQSKLNFKKPFNNILKTKCKTNFFLMLKKNYSAQAYRTKYINYKLHNDNSDEFESKHSNAYLFCSNLKSSNILNYLDQTLIQNLENSQQNLMQKNIKGLNKKLNKLKRTR